MSRKWASRRRTYRWNRLLGVASLVVAVLVWLPATPAGAAPVITFVQGAYAVPQAPQTSVAVKFTGAQTAGNLNVVVVGWSDSTSSVTSVTDSSHNTYNPAVGPTVLPGVFTQSIFYANNIAAAGAGANTVTVAFSSPAAFPDIRVLEYSGVDALNPVDVTAASTGNGTVTNSGAATTTSAADLILGANVVETTTTGPGTSFTQRLLTSPDADIVEDRMVSAIGSYSATAPITPSGRWVMQMVAFRAATGDTTPPSAPSSLTATPTANRIALNWNASTDNVGVTSYLVERCQGPSCTFTQIATPTATTYTDAGLSAGNYSYRVRAVDAAGNTSAYSNVATTTITDATPPTAPTNLTATVTGGNVSLTWTASTDNVGVTGYQLERCQGNGCSNFTQIATPPPTATSYNDNALPVGTYSYRLRAVDAAGNQSLFSNVAPAVVPDTVLPTAPTNLSATPAGATVNLSWTASTDNVGVTAYQVERCQGTGCTFTQIAAPTGTTYSDTGLSVGSYSYRVRAVDGATNQSPYSNTANTSILDVTPPTAPTNLTATATGNRADLSWTASTDNVGVNAYEVEYCAGPGCTLFAKIATPTGTTFSDLNLNPGPYSFRVRAVDAAGNTSPYSNTANATILDTQAPTAPGGLTATASGTQITLGWTASTDNVGVTSYQVERCQGPACSTFAIVAPINATTYTDTGLPVDSFSYRVRAFDAALNPSPYSNVATAITVSTPPGALAAYAFNEGTGTTTADASGNGVTGTLQGPSWTNAGKNGKALSFNGTSNYVDLGRPSVLNSTGSMTWEAWVNAAGNPPDDGQIIALSDDNSGWQLKTTPDTGPRTFAIAISADGASHTQRYSNATVALNTWYHVAAVYNATVQTLDVFVNGVVSDGVLTNPVGARSSIPSVQVLPPASVNANIGRRTGGYNFNGINRRRSCLPAGAVAGRDPS